jgi:hypothetical protein
MDFSAPLKGHGLVDHRSVNADQRAKYAPQITQKFWGFHFKLPRDDKGISNHGVAD